MALSRQKTAGRPHDRVGRRTCRPRAPQELLAAEGGEPAVTLFATGTEVALAVAARDILQGQGKPTRVVSVPCWELFEQQPVAYRQAVIGTAAKRVAVEAGIRQGWDRFIGEDGGFVGMTGFGASAPFERLYKEFGITAEAVAAAAA